MHAEEKRRADADKSARQDTAADQNTCHMWLADTSNHISLIQIQMDSTAVA